MGCLQRRRYRAVIFDMDGVLVDSEAYYLYARAQFLREQGVPVSDDELSGLVGASLKVDREYTYRWFVRAGRALSAQEIASLEEAWWAGRAIDYRDLLNPGVPRTLLWLREHGVRLALASSSPMSNILEVLDACGIEGYFEIVMSGEQFHESKPNPEIYLKTLSHLGLDAHECCCVEDSAFGISAGRAAGLTVFAKREDRFGFSQEDADVVIDQVYDLLDYISVEHA